MSEAIVRSTNLSYTYPNTSPIRFPDIETKRGQHLLITGNSGVGKTTLLHLLSGLLKVKEGNVWVSGTDLSTLSSKDLDAFRGRHIGFVFQQPKFISSLTARENLAAAQYFSSKGQNQAHLSALLRDLGIENKANSKTSKLSGGERQRLAIARALASKPDIVLADEPTSALDDENALAVKDLLVREADENGATLIIVTHDLRLQSHFQNRIAL